MSDRAIVWTHTTDDDCYSDHPVEVGQMRYVGRTNSQGKCIAHVVVALAGERRLFDPESRSMVTYYRYVSRLATAAEETAYLGLPRAVCSAWRAA